MAYSTIDLIRKSLGYITVDELPDEDITEAIEETDSIIDSYIASRYALPLPVPEPKLIQRISRNITACNLCEDMIASGVSIQGEGRIKNRCERAKETLENLRTGKQQLIDDITKEILPENENSASIPWSSNNELTHPQFFDIDEDTDWAFQRTQLREVDDNRDD